MSLSRLWAFLAVALPVVASLLVALPATDLTYHLRAGAEILDTGGIPALDTWTFTAAGLPWTDQQWGAQVVFEAVERLAGWTGLALLRAGLVGVIAGSMLVICRRHQIGWRSAALITLGAFVVAAPAMALRPQLVGMALFAVTLLLVDDRAEHPRRLWIVPLLTVAWANIHGSFFLAPTVLGLTWLSDVSRSSPRRHLTLAVAAVSVVAACVTPFGPAVWLYAVALGANPEVTTRITEWQPTTLRDASGFVFFASVAVVAIFLARRGRPTPWPTLAWLGFFFVIGLYAARGIAWWPLAAVAALAPMLGGSPGPSTAERPEPRAMRMLNTVVAGALVLAGVALLPALRPPGPVGVPEGVVSQAPMGLTATLRGIVGPDDRLFNAQPWGSWFEYALPGTPVAIDSRIELFPAALWRDYVAVLEGRAGWEAILERWGVTLVAAAEPSDGPFSERLAEAGWLVLDEDRDGTILAAPGRAE